MKFITTILFLGPLLLSAQNREDQCLVADYVDEFTKVRTIEIGTDDYGGSAPHIRFRKIGSEMSVLMTYGVSYAQAMVVGKDDKFLLKLANDTVIELRSLAISKADITTQVIGTGLSTSTILRCHYRIEPWQVSMLASVPVAAVRIYTVEGYYDEDMAKRKKWPPRLMKVAGCFQDFLNR